MIRVSPYLHTPEEAQAAIDFIKSQGIECTLKAKDLKEDLHPDVGDKLYPLLISSNGSRTVWTCVAQILEDPDEDEPTLEAHLSEYWGKDIEFIDPHLGYNWKQPTKKIIDKFFEL